MSFEAIDVLCIKFDGEIIVKNVKQFLADESGAVSVEYGFAILFAASIATAVLTVVRNEVSTAFLQLSNKLEAQVNAVR